MQLNQLNRKFFSKGWSLIELMIVVAIIGILASVAIPAYQDYVVRARVIEGLHLASAAKLAVAEVVMTTHELPPHQKSTGYVSPPPTANVADIHIADNGTGEVTISYTKAAGDGTLLLKPTLSPDGNLVWRCQLGSLAKRYRPADCR